MQLRLSALSVFGFATSVSTMSMPILDTPYGRVAGLSRVTPRGAVDVFLGVPFAAAPTGRLRFSSPREPTPWSGTRNATSAGPPCQQLGGLGMFGGLPPLEKFSEDCLTLNVFAPAHKRAPNAQQGKTKPLLPILFWLHGGGFTGGSSYTSAVGDLNRITGITPVYDGAALAAREGIVVVSANYRVGGFGFLRLNGTNATGAAAFEDQRAALRWVQRAASSFGADPARVALVGESAGGASVLHHLVSPASRGLFSAAIVESGYVPVISAAEAEEQSVALAAKLGCDGSGGGAGEETPHDPHALLACMQSRPLAHDVLRAAVGLQTASVVVAGGSEMPEDPNELIARGQLGSAVPLLIGTNRDEDAILDDTCGNPRANMTWHALDAWIASEFGNGTHAAALSARYGADRFASARDALERLKSDRTFCASRALARTLAGGPLGCNVWLYHLVRGPWFTRALWDALHGLRDAAYCFGVPHGTDLVYLFQHENGLLAPPGRAIADFFARAWGGMARAGAAPGAWTPVCQNASVMVLGDETSSVVEYESELCELFEPGSPKSR